MHLVTDDERSAWRAIFSSVLWLVRVPIYPMVWFGRRLRNEYADPMPMVEWCIMAVIVLFVSGVLPWPG